MRMGGGKASSHKPSSTYRKSRLESGNNPRADQKQAAAGDSKSSDTVIVNKKGNNDVDPNPKSNPSPTPSQPKPSSERDPPPGVSLPFPDVLGRPPPPRAYGFHMLERRTIVLGDGSIRSYLALPRDYQDFNPRPRPLSSHRSEFPGPGLGDRRFPPGGPLSPDFRGSEDLYMRGRNQDHWNSLGFDGRGGGPLSFQPPENSLKRKFGDEGPRGRRDEREENNAFERQRQQLLQYGNSN